MAYIARTIDQIFQELLVEKQTFTSLNELDQQGIVDEASLIAKLADSKVAEWILWLYNLAVQIHLTEVRTATAVSDLETIIATEKVPTDAWYINKTLEFQYGDSVIVDPITYQVKYNIIDVTKQIVASAAIENIDKRIILKIRRKISNIFSVDELNALTSYLDNIKIAGTNIELFNYAGDLFTLNMEVVYDAIYDLPTIQSEVESVVNEYLGNLEIDGYFITANLMTKLQAILGVKYVRFNESTVTDDLAVTTNFIHEYKSLAGWGEVNPITPLASTVTYLTK